MRNNEIIPGFDDEKDDALTIQLEAVSEIPGCVVLHLAGYIDGRNRKYFKSRVSRVIESGFGNLLFDCAKLEYAPDFFLGDLGEFLLQVTRLGGDLVLLNVQSEHVASLAEIGMRAMFKVADDLQEAVALLRRAGPGS